MPDFTDVSLAAEYLASLLSDGYDDWRIMSMLETARRSGVIVGQHKSGIAAHKVQITHSSGVWSVSEIQDGSKGREQHRSVV